MKMQHKDPIPGKSASRAEVAEFWDTHSIADYWDELKPIRVNFAKNLSEGMTIRFDHQTLQSLREEANKKGIGATTLVRMWVKERLQTEDRRMAA